MEASFAPDSIFFISTWSIFSLLVFTSETPYLLESKVAVIFMLFVWILNASFLRFADQISLYMLAFTLSTGILIASSFQIILFISYWLVVSPLPYLISAGPPSNPDCPIAYKPFNINRLIQACSEFISYIPSESKVILSLKDPNGDYAKIYDGYRVNFELLFYTANINNILVLPDWWAIFKLNDILLSQFGLVLLQMLQQLLRDLMLIMFLLHNDQILVSTLHGINLDLA